MIIIKNDEKKLNLQKYLLSNAYMALKYFIILASHLFIFTDILADLSIKSERNNIFKLLSDEDWTLNATITSTEDDSVVCKWYKINEYNSDSIIYYDSIVYSLDTFVTNTPLSLKYTIEQDNYYTINKSQYYLTVTSKEKNSSVISDTMYVESVMPNTGLPTIYIVTDSGKPIVSKEEYIDAQFYCTLEEDTVINEQHIKIRGRGNATWTYPKRPYKIKFDKKISLFGMNKGKEFALLANYCDKSLMRTAIGFKVSELVGMEWTPSSHFVDLIINNEYLGTYQITETVKADKNRINISNSGFLIQEDNLYYNEEPLTFATELFSKHYNIKSPQEDAITNEQEFYIQSYINDLERIIMYSDYNQILDYIDITTFLNYYYVSTVLDNIDPNIYLYKEDNTSDTKLKIGPLWDLEWSLGIGWYDGPRPRPDHVHSIRPWSYLEYMFFNPLFISEITLIHNNIRNELEQEIEDFYSELSETLNLSQEMNFKRWDILNEIISAGGIPLHNWEAEYKCDLEFFKQQLAYLDQIFYLENDKLESISKQEPSSLPRIFTPSGVYVGNDYNLLKPGIYICNGKVIIKR